MKRALEKGSDEAGDMENVPICQVCERVHEVGRGWTFCTGERYHFTGVGLRSVGERAEAFWRNVVAREDAYACAHAARLLLPSVMSKLLDARADPNLCAPPVAFLDDVDEASGVAVHQKETPLHLVLRNLELRYWYAKDVGKAEAVPECVELLLQHKADLNLQDVWGRTPLQVVSQHRRAGLHFSALLNSRV